MKVFTLATKELSDSQIDKWVKSAQFFGYNYEILARSEKYQGHNMKMRYFHKALSDCKDKVVMLTDSSDLFFSAPATEMLKKFKRLKKSIVVGGEMYLYYKHGKNDENKVQYYFWKIRESSQCFPNSGFIIGYRDKLLKYLKDYLDYSDDQASIIDYIIDHMYNTSDVYIDYHTMLIGNVSNFHEKNYKSINYYSFDDNDKRYKNKISGELPCAFHFPGKNFDPMNKFYSKIFNN